MDTLTSWLGVGLAAAAVAGLVVFAVRRLTRVDTTEFEREVSLFDEPYIPVFLPDQPDSVHSTAYHHRMEEGKRHWIFGDPSRCPCNNGARLDGISLASERWNDPTSS